MRFFAQTICRLFLSRRIGKKCPNTVLRDVLRSIECPIHLVFTIIIHCFLPTGEMPKKVSSENVLSSTNTTAFDVLEQRYHRYSEIKTKKQTWMSPCGRTYSLTGITLKRVHRRFIRLHLTFCETTSMIFARFTITNDNNTASRQVYESERRSNGL